MLFIITNFIFIFSQNANYEINRSDSLINNSKIYIDSNDSDYITNSSFYKNYNGNIEIKNNINFENIFSFKNYLVNKFNCENETSIVFLKRNISNNEIIIYNIINSKEYNEKLMNMLISIISEKEFGIYVKLHNNFKFISNSNINFFYYFFLILLIVSIIGNKMQIPFYDRISQLKHILFLNGTNLFFYWLGFFIFDLIIISILSVFLFFFNKNFLRSLNTLFLFIVFVFLSYICSSFCDKFEYSLMIFIGFGYMPIYLIFVFFIF